MVDQYEVGHFDYQNPVVGAIVYPPYEINKVGKVISFTEVDQHIAPRTYFRTLVRMANGKDYTKLSLHLSCFRCLVAGHERKAKKQGAMLKEAEALWMLLE